MYAQKLEEVLFEVQNVSCFVITSRNKKNLTMADLSYAGNALFDFSRNFSLRTERGAFPFISNEELIIKFKELVGGGNIDWRIIYYNNDKTDFYLNGIIKEWRGLTDPKGTLLKSSVELSNSYTGRFSPRMQFSIYNPDLKVFLKTPQSFGTTDTFTRNTYQQLYPDFIDSHLNPDPLQTIVPTENLNITANFLAHLPRKIQDTLLEEGRKLAIYYGGKIPLKFVKIYFMTWIALTAHKWSATNYEHSREFQHFAYERIVKLLPDSFYLDNDVYFFKL